MDVHHPVTFQVLQQEETVARLPPRRLLKSSVHHPAQTRCIRHGRPNRGDDVLAVAGRVHHLIKGRVAQHRHSDQLLLQRIDDGAQRLLRDVRRGGNDHLLVYKLHIGPEVVYASQSGRTRTIQKIARDGGRIGRGLVRARRDAGVVSRAVDGVAEGVIVDEGAVDVRYVLRSAVVVWVHVGVGRRLHIIQPQHEVVILKRLVDRLVYQHGRVEYALMVNDRQSDSPCQTADRWRHSGRSLLAAASS